jgi:hypothetical protein
LESQPTKGLGEVNKNVLNVPLPILPTIEETCLLLSALQGEKSKNNRMPKKEIQKAIEKCG